MEYWVWLSGFLRGSASRFSEIIDRFGSARAVFEADINSLASSGLFTRSEISAARERSLSFARDIIADSKNRGIKIISYDSPDYPEMLKTIPDPPAVLFCRGTLPDLNTRPSLCIVGPRECSEFGQRAAFSLSRRLSRGGMIIVSGGTVGADYAAHKGALSAGGLTVAVLPCGLDCDYLRPNKALRGEIAERGCLISEYPADYPVKQGVFQRRNRIMSALTLGTVVIEAGEHSGALITARHAAEQGRDVFVIPGNPTSPRYVGSNALLRDGAKPLLSARDVFYEYIDSYQDKLDIEKAYEKSDSAVPLPKPEKPARKRPKRDDTVKRPAPEPEPKPERIEVSAPQDLSFLSEAARRLYAALPERGAFLPDELETSLSASELLASSAELEIFGFLRALPGGRYERIL